MSVHAPRKLTDETTVPFSCANNLRRALHRRITTELSDHPGKEGSGFHRGSPIIARLLPH
jgi:hypothetical protein